MNKETLDSFVGEMTNLLKTAKDFTVEQVPQVAKEILRYNAALDMMWIVVGMVGLFLSYKFYKFTKKLCKTEQYEILYVVVGCTSIISVITTLASAADLLKIELAPRVFLLEYLARLVQTK